MHLSNIDLVFPGGGAGELARRDPPEEREKYPEFRMFGPLPAYGLWSRHVRGLVMRDVRIRSLKPDARPALGHVDTV